MARLAQPSASLNTPYAFATSPWGQKSLSTGKVKPCCSAQMRCAWRESHEIASTCAPCALERRRVVADLAELTLAHTGEGERVEDDHDRLAPQLGERDVVAVLVLEREIGATSPTARHGVSSCRGLRS